MSIPFYEEVEPKYEGRKVFVYFNLHKKCWSVKSLDTNRVMLHCNTVTLRDATFRVSEPGRLRVNAEGRKNVHAGIQGYIVRYSDYSGHDGGGHGIRYNPYEFHTFVTTEGGTPMHGAKFVSLMAHSSCKVMGKDLTSIDKHLQRQKAPSVDDIIRQLETLL